jgi:hypothetical protein
VRFAQIRFISINSKVVSFQMFPTVVVGTILCRICG